MTLKNDWNYLRNPEYENYKVLSDSIELKSTEITLNEAKSPTWIGVRACEFEEDFSCDVLCSGGEAGLSIMMDENHHYEVFIKNENGKCTANLRLRIGPCDYVKKSIWLNTNSARLRVLSNNYSYSFFVNEECLGSADTRYLSSEVAGGFTGVYNGLFAVGNGQWNKFTDLKIIHKE